MTKYKKNQFTYKFTKKIFENYERRKRTFDKC